MASEHTITSFLPALLEGDSQAVQVAWNTFFVRLCRLADKRLAPARQRATAGEDIAASAFASVCRRLKDGQYANISSRDELWRLLATVARRKACTLLRDEGRKKRGGGKVTGESVFRRQDGTAAHGLDDLASAEPSPAFIAEMTETIQQLFAGLDEQARQVALLKLEQRQNAEIAKRLGRSIATVERKLKLIRATWSSIGMDNS